MLETRSRPGSPPRPYAPGASRPLPGPRPTAPATATSAAAAATPKRRVVGVDVARGLALIGMISIHILPAWDPQTYEPTVQWQLFSGRAAALFVLLAGVSLAFLSGGRTPRRGRDLAAARAGLLVRALLIAALGLGINELMPTPAPAISILVYYGMIFLLAIPFLGRSAGALFAWAGVFAVAGPVLMQALRPVLPAFDAYNPTFTDVFTAPGATLAQLLLTGSYPVLPYLAYLLAGLAIGRLDLSAVRVQTGLLLGGVALAVAAWLTYWVLILQLGGYGQLMAATSWMSETQIDETIVFGPDPSLPTTTWWWLLTPGPHSNTWVALAIELGSAMAVLGACLLLTRGAGKWALPLSAMGSMTLTLYSAHLLVLSTEVHYDRPGLWFLVHVAVAALFAVLWHRVLGQGPLERVVARIAGSARTLVLCPARG